MVHKSGRCETLWAELKAVDHLPKKDSSRLGLRIEPSQHMWMEKHASLVPAVFIIRTPASLVVVPGTRHGQLPYINQAGLDAEAIWRMPAETADPQDLISALTILSARPKREIS